LVALDLLVAWVDPLGIVDLDVDAVELVCPLAALRVYHLAGQQLMNSTPPFLQL
jgi:hypothetical protein